MQPSSTLHVSDDKAVTRLLLVVAAILAMNLFVDLRRPKGVARSADDPRFGYVQIRDHLPLPDREDVLEMVDLRTGNAWGFAGYDEDPIYLGRYRLEAMDGSIPRRP